MRGWKVDGGGGRGSGTEITERLRLHNYLTRWGSQRGELHEFLVKSDGGRSVLSWNCIRSNVLFLYMRRGGECGERFNLKTRSIRRSSGGSFWKASFVVEFLFHHSQKNKPNVSFSGAPVASPGWGLFQK